MKKTFNLKSTKIDDPRQVEAVKHQIKKYMAREKRKKLPEKSDYWDFECQIGIDENSAQDIYPNEIRKKIDEYVIDGVETFYIKIASTPKRF